MTCLSFFLYDILLLRILRNIIQNQIRTKRSTEHLSSKRPAENSSSKSSVDLKVCGKAKCQFFWTVKGKMSPGNQNLSTLYIDAIEACPYMFLHSKRAFP